MTTPRERSSSALPAVPTSTVVLLLGAGVIVVALVVGLIAFVGEDGRGEAFAWLSSIFALVASATGVGSLVQVQRLSRGAEATHETVSKVQKQTNGMLDARITTAITTASEDVLRRAGIDVAAKEL